MSTQTLIDDEQQPERHGCIWRQWEDEYLKRTYPATGAKPCAARLRRTRKAIYERVSALGVQVEHTTTGRPHVWSERDGMLVEYLVAGVAEEVGVTERAVCARIWRKYRAGDFDDNS